MAMNPVLSSNVGYERPVEQPSALAGVSNLANLFVSATRPAQAEKPTESMRQQEALQPYAQRLAELRNSDLTETQFTKEARRLQREVSVQYPQYSDTFRGIVQKEYGVEGEVLPVTPQDNLATMFNQYAGTPEGQSDMIRALSFDTNGNLDEDATQLRFNELAAQSLAEQGAIVRSERKLKASQDNVALWKSESELQLQEFLPQWTTKSQGIVDSLVLSAINGRLEVDTPEEQIAYLRNARRSLVDEYTAKSQAAGLHPDVYSTQLERAVQPLDNLLNTMTAMAGDTETVLNAYKNAQKLQMEKLLTENLGVLSQSPEFMREVFINLGTEFYSAEGFRKAVSAAVEMASTQRFSGLDFMPRLPSSPEQAATEAANNTSVFSDVIQEMQDKYKSNPEYLADQAGPALARIATTKNSSTPEGKQSIFRDLALFVTASEVSGQPVGASYLNRIFEPKTIRMLADVANAGDTVGSDTKSAVTYFVTKQMARNTGLLNTTLKQVPEYSVERGEDGVYRVKLNGGVVSRPSRMRGEEQVIFDSVDNLNILYSGLSRFQGVKEAVDAVIPKGTDAGAIEDYLENLGMSGGGGGGGGGEASYDYSVSNGRIAQDLGLDFGGVEEEYGLPAGYLERTAEIESSGDPSAKNPNSSAGGLFQQIDSNAKAYGVKDRFDPLQSTVGAAKFAQANTRILRRALGREPTSAELYLAHQQGGQGAARLLSNQTAKAADIVGKRAVTLNGGTPDMTAGEFASIWINKFNGGGRGRATSMSQALGTQEVPPMASPRPMQRPTIDTEMPTTGSMTGATGAGTLPVQEDTAEGEPPSEARTEAPRATAAQVENARRVWGTLAEETQRTLARILGSDEEAIRMLAEKEITEEDMRNV